MIGPEFGNLQTKLGLDERGRNELDLSVIVCTRDRASSLNRFLLSATLLEIPPETIWELLIVDNGSTDNTAEIVNSFEDRLPVKRLWQPEAGKSNAINLGIRQAAGKYILWTDDDVLLDKAWLAAYREAFRRWPDAALFGGKVTPLLKEPTPVWFRSALPDLGFLLAARDFGDDPIPLSVDGDLLPYGVNFAIRTEVQRLHPFDPALGVAPGRRRGGEETAVIRAVLQSGKAGWWVPGAAVAHVIPAERQTTAYISRYYEGLGEQDAYSQVISRSAPLLGAPLPTWIKVVVGFVRYRLARLARLKSWVRYLSSYAYHRGVLGYWLTPPDKRR